MTFKEVVLEKDIVNIDQLQKYLSNFYPVEQRRKLKVIYPFAQDEYAIVLEEDRFCLVNLSILSIACIGNVGQNLVDFVELICRKGYKVFYRDE